MALVEQTKQVGKHIDGSQRYQVFTVTLSGANHYFFNIKDSLQKSSSKGYIICTAAIEFKFNGTDKSDSAEAGVAMDGVPLPADTQFQWDNGLAVDNIFIPTGQSGALTIYAE